jgi:hypothetical protein
MACAAIFWGIDFAPCTGSVFVIVAAAGERTRVAVVFSNGTIWNIGATDFAVIGVTRGTGVDAFAA